MNFEYNGKYFQGTYSQIKAQVLKYLENEKLFLQQYPDGTSKWILAKETYQFTKGSIWCVDIIKPALIAQILAKIPKNEDYFDDNVKIIAENGTNFVIVKLDNIILRTAAWFTIKQLEEIKKDWLNSLE